MKRILAPLLLAFAVMAPVPAQAVVVLYLDPSAQVVDIGDTVSVDIVIDGLGNLGTPSLSAFDLDILFDDDLLSVTGVAFGSELDQGILGSSQGVDSLPGSHNVFEFSDEESSTLISLQPGSFVLATLTFATLAEGSSALGIDVLGLLGDESSGPLTASTTGATVTIQTATTVVPLPAAAWLLLSVLGGLFSMGRLCKRREYT
jgi:hypothetical protein